MIKMLKFQSKWVLKFKCVYFGLDQLKLNTKKERCKNLHMVGMKTVLIWKTYYGRVFFSKHFLRRLHNTKSGVLVDSLLLMFQDFQ